MNIQSNSYENTNPKCKGCKLFFAAEAFQGYCSTCFKKQKGTDKQTIEKVKVDSNDIKKQQVPKLQVQKQQEKQPKDKSRCHDCKRKVGLLGVECKCGEMFCNKHRMPEDHKCTFDHMSVGTKNLEKNLIKLQHGKIDKI